MANVQKTDIAYLNYIMSYNFNRLTRALTAEDLTLQRAKISTPRAGILKAKTWINFNSAFQSFRNLYAIK